MDMGWRRSGEASAAAPRVSPLGFGADASPLRGVRDGGKRRALTNVRDVILAREGGEDPPAARDRDRTQSVPEGFPRGTWEPGKEQHVT